MVRILSSEDVKNKPVEVNYAEGEWAYYFQIIGIGPTTMAQENFQPTNLPARIPGYFASGNKEEIREFIHKLVDSAFKALEENK